MKMNSKSRSLSGAALMLVIIPILAGLLACMPVPIGNPERSKIDPELSGLWVFHDADEIGVFLLEPYDKRTYLGLFLDPSVDNAKIVAEYGTDSYEGLVAAMSDKTSGYSLVTADKISLYKIWLTTLGGEQFMVWQPKGVFEGGEFGADYAYNWRIRKAGDSKFELNFINDAHPAVKDVKEDKKDLERAIREHASDPELYDDESYVFTRVPKSDEDLFGGLISGVVTDE
jgi:hypothetical protein